MGRTKKGAAKKKKTPEEFFDKLVAAPSNDGWQTGPVSAMDMGDDDYVPVEPKGDASTGEEAGPSGKGKQAKHKGMDVDGKPKGIKLGVANTSMKRGQHTTNQRLRKAKKIQKAVARSEKVGVKVEGKLRKKATKSTLKHIYD